jgi:radical SAM-linked protein
MATAPAEPPTRYRLTFAKTEAMRYTGNLDLMRTLERTIRRAGLPLAYSQGFSHHPRLHLAAALPLGFVSDAELADIWLEHDLPAEEVLARLAQAAPPGLRFLAIGLVPLKEPALQEETVAATYEVRLPIDQPALALRLLALLDASQLPRVRRGKSYDLRALIEDGAARTADDGESLLELRLAARPGATGRPEEVLDALGLEPLSADVRRTGLILRELDVVP